MSSASLIFNSKQLEELESLHDSSGAFEEENDDSGSDDVGEGAMEWRRSLIEEASENVKRAKTRPVDPSITYEVGSLLLDRESQRFGRVNRSVPGYLRILYLTGGDREYGLLDVRGYLQEVATGKRLSELALQLGMSESDVERELDHLGLTPLEEEQEDDTGTSAAAAPDSDDDDDDEWDAEAQPAEAPKKSSRKSSSSTTAKSASPKTTAASSDASDTKPAKKARRATSKPARSAAARAAKATAVSTDGKKANPIDDPNEFIRQNYMEMSNRELARHTGLSEHTIRRKLGEWGLKRKK